MTDIADRAFSTCGIRVIEEHDTGYSMTGNGFHKLMLPKSLRTIGQYAFMIAHIDEVVINEGITDIPSYGFGTADVLNVKLPDTVTEIEPYAFYRGALREIRLPDHLETIGEAAFAGNMRMKTTLPDSVKFIGEGAFWLNYGWASLGAAAEEWDGFDNMNNGYVVCSADCHPKMEERAFYDAVSLGVVENSDMHTYAAQNRLYHVFVNSDLKCELKKEWLDGFWNDDFSCVYMGIQEGMPAAPYNLTKGKDYTVSYGKKGLVYVTGIGFMTGKLEYDSSEPGFYLVENSNKLPVKIAKIKAKSRGFTIKWKVPQGSVTGYQIQYSENKKFITKIRRITQFDGNNIKTQVTVTKTRTKKIKGKYVTKWSAKRLKPKKKYYIRIRTYTKSGGHAYYSKWSKVKKVTTKK